MSQLAVPVCGGCGHSASQPDARFCSRCGYQLISQTPASETGGSVTPEGDHSSPESVLICRARCSRSKQPFAIKFEQRDRGIWFARSAWAVDEKRIGSQVFSSGAVRGHFKKHGEYPGCPHCGNSLWRMCFECNQGLGCLEYGGPSYTCPWCGALSVPKWGRRSSRTIQVPGAKD